MKAIPSDATGIAALTTERNDPRFADIDRLPVGELAALMKNADADVPGAVKNALPQITAALEAVVERMKAGGRLIYVGSGTAGRMGVLDASECPPTFGTPPDQVFAIIAGGPKAVSAPCEGAEDDVDAGARAIDAARVGHLDTVVGIASSGRTPYVLAAVARARELGALTVGFACNTGSPLAAAAAYPLEVVVGPEVLSGSTRLKAGTAQKLVLNMFSTIAMVQLGKTYGNHMVDLKASNGKLRERAVQIVQAITGADRASAVAALEENHYDVKQSIVVLRLGLDPEAAAARLDASRHRLRVALGELI